MISSGFSELGMFFERMDSKQNDQEGREFFRKTQ